MISVPEDLSDLDLTPASWKWRPNQRALVEQIINSDKPIIMLEAECGSGKSLIAMAAARVADVHTMLLVQTIQLQNQYLNDFAAHVKLIEGRAHSTCNLTNKSASTAPCVAGMKCELKGTWRFGKFDEAESLPECNYFRRKAVAQMSPVTVANYAYWLNEIRSDAPTFGAPDWVICDEGHKLDEILMSVATVKVNDSDLRLFDIVDPIPLNSSSLRGWLDRHFETINAITTDDEARASEMVNNYTIERLMSDPLIVEFFERYQVGKTFVGALRVLNRLDDTKLSTEWVCDRKGRVTSIKPIYGKYGFEAIRRAAKTKIIIMSAFLAPTLLTQTLGLDPDDVEIIEAPPVFDRTNSRIFYTPTVKMKFGMPNKHARYIFDMINEIALAHGTQKGIIHVPSIALRDGYLSAARQRDRIIAYDGVGTDPARVRFGTKDQAIAEFTESKKPLILLGQSISTGLDLPHVPRWQIIVKVPFASTADPAIARRMEVDKDFYTHQTICEIVQAAGRIKRAPTHDGPTFILDAQFGWFFQRNKEHFPLWFRRATIYNGWKHQPALDRARRRLSLQAGILI